MHSWRNVALATAFLGSAHLRPAMAQATGSNCFPGVCSGRVRAVSVQPASVTLPLNGVAVLKGYIVADADVTNRTVLWSSTDSRVVSVDAAGEAAARGVGTARIVATAAADRNMKASVVVTVLEQTSGGTFNLIAAPPEAANSDDVVYFEFQVQKHVTVIPGAPAPRYPTELREANVEGSVLMQFVVDANGMADTTTINVLKSTHDLFTTSVRATLPLIHFTPAEVGGRKVKQLVQMPFQFSLTRTPPPTR